VIAKENRLLAIGYAGSIAGLEHCVDVGCMIENERCVRTVHAEINALIQVGRLGTPLDGATVFSTMSPCWECFKVLANAGVRRVAFDVQYVKVERQIEAAQKLGIAWDRLGTALYAPYAGAGALRWK
jgi:dCMP deaminase